MGIINRTKEPSEQRRLLEFAATAAVATGVSAIIGYVETPCILEAGQIAAFGLSGAPSYQIVVNRFIAGIGFTAITVGSANIPPAFGTSGVAATGVSLPASGSTLNNLLANDVVMFQSGVANTAAAGLSIKLVVRAIQDTVKYFGGLV